MATSPAFYAGTCVSQNPVGGDIAWSAASSAQGADDGSGASAYLDATNTFSEELYASNFGTNVLSILSVEGIQMRVKKSYSPVTNTAGLPEDAAGSVYWTISGSTVGDEQTLAGTWPNNDYDTYGGAATTCGINASTLRTALRNNTLGFVLRGVNNNTDIEACEAFVLEFELVVTYTPLTGAPQMAMMGVGM